MSPRSESPAIRDEREDLYVLLRRTVLTRGDTHAMCRLAATPESASDEELTDRLLKALPRTDPRRAAVLYGRSHVARDADR
ncbi:MAG TPA: hypothetical protein VH352_26175 [Pseudonocardiaceae bacterium]|nr:hypothetical protein [Pseudonocardiaceae bacterium]